MIPARNADALLRSLRARAAYRAAAALRARAAALRGSPIAPDHFPLTEELPR